MTEKRLGKIVSIGIILFFGIFFNYKHLNELPNSVHAWAQVDHYAISVRFTENNLNFFKPETYIYNKQFSGHKDSNKSFFLTKYDNTITSIDFPLTNYIPAILMKVIGTNAPWVFRCFVLLISFIGLFYLYRLALLITNSVIKSLFVLIFATSSPFFIFYQANFLPSMTSFSVAVIGVFYYTKYLYLSNNKHFNIALLFFTLAALMRTTFLIPLIALFCVEGLKIIRKKTNLKPKLISILISIVFIISYFLYNKYLRNQYGSNFLNSLLYAKSWDDIVYVVKEMDIFWREQFFTIYHYFLFVIIVLASIIFIKNKSENKKLNTRFGFFAGVTLFGVNLFFVAMIWQFQNHDYYFLDTFYLPILLLLIFFIHWLPNPYKPYSKIIVATLIAVFAFFSFQKVDEFFNWRYEAPWWNENARITNENFTNADQFLDENYVSKEAKILTIRDGAPNLPYIHMKRKGYYAESWRQSSVEQIITWDWEYLILEKSSTVLEQYPVIEIMAKKVAENETLELYVPLF